MKTSLADKWFSLFIRLRDADENGMAACITCGRVKLVKYMDCGHYVKRQHPSRFNEKCCAAQCKKCNKFGQGEDVIFRQKLVELYGEDAVLLLEAGKRQIVHMPGWKLKLIADEYKEKARKLSKEKGIELW